MRLLILIALIAIVFANEEEYSFELPSDWHTIRTNIDTSFSCVGRAYGYYADVANECQVYHVCQPRIEDERTVYTHNPFICPLETVFDQVSLTCIHSTPEFNCANSVNHYAATENYLANTAENYVPNVVANPEYVAPNLVSSPEYVAPNYVAANVISNTEFVAPNVATNAIAPPERILVEPVSNVLQPVVQPVSNVLPVVQPVSNVLPAEPVLNVAQPVEYDAVNPSINSAPVQPNVVSNAVAPVETEARSNLSENRPTLPSVDIPHVSTPKIPKIPDIPSSNNLENSEVSNESTLTVLSPRKGSGVVNQEHQAVAQPPRKGVSVNQQNVVPVAPQVVRKGIVNQQNVVPVAPQVVRKSIVNQQNVVPVAPQVVRKGIVNQQNVVPVAPQVVRKSIVNQQNVVPVAPQVVRKNVVSLQNQQSVVPQVAKKQVLRLSPLVFRQQEQQIVEVPRKGLLANSYVPSWRHNYYHIARPHYIRYPVTWA